MIEESQWETEDTFASLPRVTPSVTAPPHSGTATAAIDISSPVVRISTQVTTGEGPFRLPASSPLGSAVRRRGPGRIAVDVDRLIAIYRASTPTEKQQRDIGNSGCIQTDFAGDQEEYEDGRYE
ncbi:MAG: hypothetical protein U9R79_15625 [Armatimonadota bacterium]|nr:hypothetical protein [Armatimonadota bacterium]